MGTKELKIDIPEGYEIDKENSTFECIKFKPVKKSKFSDYDSKYRISGYYISEGSDINTFNINTIYDYNNSQDNKNVFITEKQAKSALAMAQIGQIMINDGRFGGIVTDKEWGDGFTIKYCILKYNNQLSMDCRQYTYHFLAFHTAEQRDLFLKENEQLVKDYLMVEDEWFQNI